jgi:hypothetical protein
MDDFFMPGYSPNGRFFATMRLTLSALRFALCPIYDVSLRNIHGNALRQALCAPLFALSSLLFALRPLRSALCASRSALYDPCLDGTGILLDFTRLSDNISGSVIFPPEKIPESLIAATGRSSTVSRLNRLPTCVP